MVSTIGAAANHRSNAPATWHDAQRMPLLRHLSRHPVRYAALALLIAFVVITVVKTAAGDWFSFR